MTWLRLTIDPMIMFDHSECGNRGACAELMTEDFMNLRLHTKTLRSLSMLSRLSPRWQSEICSLTVQGKSVSSCFGFFPVAFDFPEDAACLDPRATFSSVSGPLSLSPSHESVIDWSCCLSMLR